MARELSRAGRRYALDANEKRGWSYGWGDIEKLIRQHHDGTEDTRARIEFQLDDANWHTIAEDLSKNNYADAQRHNDDDYDPEDRDTKARKTTYQNGYVEPKSSNVMTRDEKNRRQNERRKQQRAEARERRQQRLQNPGSIGRGTKSSPINASKGSSNG